MRGQTSAMRVAGESPAPYGRSRRVDPRRRDERTTMTETVPPFTFVVRAPFEALRAALPAWLPSRPLSGFRATYNPFTHASADMWTRDPRTLEAQRQAEHEDAVAAELLAFPHVVIGDQGALPFELGRPLFALVEALTGVGLTQVD